MGVGAYGGWLSSGELGPLPVLVLVSARGSTLMRIVSVADRASVTDASTSSTTSNVMAAAPTSASPGWYVSSEAESRRPMPGAPLTLSAEERTT